MMAKRLLFVDDEPLVLDGLRRALHGMRHVWEMKFVDSAREALEELNRTQYDAVITDMRMPAMDGAEFLEIVESRHSDIVRIVLSGQSDREAVLRSIVPTHQFLSKPCSVDELKLRLGLAFAMRDAISNGSVKSVVARLRSIPSLPRIYDELTAALRSASSSLATIEKIIESDIAMATKTLQLANSAFIGVRGEISNLRQAVSLIGTETIRTLALSVHVFSHFERNTAAARFLPALWEHSANVASLARRITLEEKQPREAAEQSFSAGLLHDVGKAVLFSELSGEYNQIVENRENREGDITSREVEQFGCTHAQIGAYLMSIWGLPATLVHAVALHHRPMEELLSRFSPLTAVHCADAIVSEGEAMPFNRDGQLDLAYLDRLGLREREAAWRDLHNQSSAANPQGPRTQGPNPQGPNLQGEHRERKDPFRR
jgi:HD-like signal output (HDOD) protein